MKILEIVVLVIAALLTLAWMYGIRTQVRRGSPPTQMTVNTAMLFAVSIVVVLVLDVSAFHLLWIFPLSVVIGLLSLAFPFSILSIPGSLFGRICLVGVRSREIQVNKARQDRFVELQRSGMTPEEAANQVVEELGRPE